VDKGVDDAGRALEKAREKAAGAWSTPWPPVTLRTYAKLAEKVLPVIRD
jgi:hypothetical protein